MLLTTRKKPLKKISEITFDLEIVNPVESKNLFGGCEYHSYCSCTGSLIIWNNYNNSYNNYNDNSNHILNGGYSSDWDKANWGNDYNNNNYDPWVDPYANPDSNGDGILDQDDLDNNGIKDANQKLVESYPGDLTGLEQAWLHLHIVYVPEMINNKNLAFLHGQGHNGVGDALRHALWSALDYFDIGAENAAEFHTLHETEHWNDEESPSDLHNNGWGYNWAIANGNAENNMAQFLADFNVAVANGDLSILP